MEFTDPSARTAPEVDPDLAALSLDDDATSDLDDLEAELTGAVTPSTTIPVEGRPGYAVRYRIDFTGKELDKLRKAAKDKRFADGIDGVKFAALLLASTCLGISRHGSEEDLSERLGATGPVTFVTRELQGMTATSGSADATVRKFYGLEGHVDAAARRLMAEAGWGDDVYALDPTE